MCKLSVISLHVTHTHTQLDIALSFHRREPTPFIPIQLLAIIESPIGLIHLKEVCKFGTFSAKHLILSALVFGSDDFLARLGQYW